VSWRRVDNWTTRERHNHLSHRRLRRSHDALPQAIAGEDQHRRHESDHQSIRRLASGFRHSNARGSQVWEGLQNSGERLPSADRSLTKRRRCAYRLRKSSSTMIQKNTHLIPLRETPTCATGG